MNMEYKNGILKHADGQILSERIGHFTLYKILVR